MRRPWRCDRYAWIQAILAEDLLFEYKGIAHPSYRELRDAKTNQVITSMLHDERYMDNLMYLESKYYAESPDYEDDWEEYVKEKTHRAGCCPHQDPEEYQQAYERLLNNRDARWEWASQRVDWDWVRDSIEMEYSEQHGLLHFLTEHPIEGVFSKNLERWISIDDIVGYCPSCNEPLDADAFKATSAIVLPAHRFQRGCSDCEDHNALGANMTCLFDRKGKLRRSFACPACHFVDALDALEGSFISKHGRPFDWPPGATFPPRRDFLGNPMNVAPWEP